MVRCQVGIMCLGYLHIQILEVLGDEDMIETQQRAARRKIGSGAMRIRRCSLNARRNLV